MSTDWLYQVFKYCLYYYGDESPCRCTVYYDSFEAFARRRNVASARTAERRLRELAQQGSAAVSLRGGLGEASGQASATTKGVQWNCFR